EVWTGGEAEILERTQAWLDDQEDGVLLTWNGSVFDLPFIDARARQVGVELNLRLTRDPSIVPKYEPIPGYEGGYDATWAGLRSRDVAYIAEELAMRSDTVWSLKPFARSLGLEPVEVDRSDIHSLTPEELSTYVASDARTPLLIAEHLVS